LDRIQRKGEPAFGREEPGAPSEPPGVEVSPPEPATTSSALRRPRIASTSIAAVPAPLASPATVTIIPAADLNALKLRLRDTHAGVFPKLSLKQKWNDLLPRFKACYQRRPDITVAQLRQQNEALLLKAVTALRKRDPLPASDLFSAREAVQDVLAGPKTFANI